MQPLVSIIMPAYNCSTTIKKSIESILAQSYTNWELLITDDNSTDDTTSIINTYARNDKRIKYWVMKDNSGAGVARNNSISYAEGRFIAFLDSDDLWHPEKLSRQILFMLENNHALTYTAYQKIDNNNNLKSVILPQLKVNHSELLKSNIIGCLTAVYDASLLGKVYMPTIRKRQDMALWLLILQKINFAWGLNEVLAYYREGHDSLSSNKVKILKTQWEFYRKYLQFNIFQSIYYFSFYVVRAIKKHHKN